MKYLTLLAGVALIGSLAIIGYQTSTAEENVREILQEENVRMTGFGYSARGCEPSDLVTLRWTGVDEQGVIVQGFACAGFAQPIEIIKQ